MEVQCSLAAFGRVQGDHQHHVLRQESPDAAFQATPRGTGTDDGEPGFGSAEPPKLTLCDGG